jgi:O-acetyl-ADP-ribose deacetylase (regulator of RNase III)
MMRHAPLYYRGDVTEMPNNSILAHVCNNAGGWGAGVVLAISNKWKEPEIKYRMWASRKKLLPLGQTQFVHVGKNQWVANMIAQTLPDPEASNEIPLKYDALKSCLKQVSMFADSLNLSIVGPRFGAGLAGGEWSKVELLIRETVLDTTAVTIYDYTTTNEETQ